MRRKRDKKKVDLPISHLELNMTEVNIQNDSEEEYDVNNPTDEKDPLALEDENIAKKPPVSRSVRPIPNLMSISSLHEEILDSISESTEQKYDNLKEMDVNAERNSDTENSTNKSRTRTKASQQKNNSKNLATESLPIDTNSISFMETMQKINPNLFMETVKKLNPKFFQETVQKILKANSGLDVSKEPKVIITPEDTQAAKNILSTAAVVEAPDSSSSKKINVRNCSRQFCSKCALEIKKSSQSNCSKCKIACIYECTICKKICENYQRLFHHLRSKCLPKNNYQCIYCSYKTPISHHFTKHVKDCHETIKTENIFECKVCGRAFKYRGSLKKHLETCEKRKVRKIHNDKLDVDINEDINNDGSSDSYASDKVFNGGPIAIYSSDSDESDVSLTNRSLNKSRSVKLNKSQPFMSNQSANIKSSKTKSENLDKSILAISNRSKPVNSEVPTLVNVIEPMQKRGRKKAPDSVINTPSTTNTVSDTLPTSTTVVAKFTDITEEELNYRRRRHKYNTLENEEKDLEITSSSFTVVHINEYSDRTYLAKLINQYCPRCDITDENDVNVKLYQTLQLCKQCQKPNLLQCLKCKKRYDRYAAMHYHMKSTCNPQKYYKCSKCDYTVTVKSSMLKHYRNRHIVDDNIYICKKCNTNFKTKVALTSHLRFCKKEIKLQCKLCDFKTIYLWSIRNHMVKVHHQKHGEFITNNTEGAVVKSFDLSNKNKKPSNVVECYCLKCEQRIENSEFCPKCNQATLFKCTICREEFNDPKSIKIHMYCKFKPVSQILSKKKSCHQCVFCKKKYTAYRTYQNHIKRCGREPRFNCAHCSYKSLYKFNMRRHLDFAHNLGPNCRTKENEISNGGDNESNKDNEVKNEKTNDVVINEQRNVTNSNPIVHQVYNCAVHDSVTNVQQSSNDSSVNQTTNWAWNYSGNNYNSEQGSLYHHSLFKM